MCGHAAWLHQRTRVASACHLDRRSRWRGGQRRRLRQEGGRCAQRAGCHGREGDARAGRDQLGKNALGNVLRCVRGTLRAHRRAGGRGHLGHWARPGTTRPNATPDTTASALGALAAHTALASAAASALVASPPAACAAATRLAAAPPAAVATDAARVHLRGDARVHAPRDVLWRRDALGAPPERPPAERRGRRRIHPAHRHEQPRVCRLVCARGADEQHHVRVDHHHHPPRARPEQVGHRHQQPRLPAGDQFGLGRQRQLALFHGVQLAARARSTPNPRRAATAAPTGAPAQPATATAVATTAGAVATTAAAIPSTTLSAAALSAAALSAAAPYHGIL